MRMAVARKFINKPKLPEDPITLMEDPLRFVKFMQWVWADELRAAKKRDESNTFRISWKFQFVSRGMVTNYRVASVRAGKGKR